MYIGDTKVKTYVVTKLPEGFKDVPSSDVQSSVLYLGLGNAIKTAIEVLSISMSAFQEEDGLTIDFDINQRYNVHDIIKYWISDLIADPLTKSAINLKAFNENPPEYFQAEIVVYDKCKNKFYLHTNVIPKNTGDRYDHIVSPVSEAIPVYRVEFASVKKEITKEEFIELTNSK